MVFGASSISGTAFSHGSLHVQLNLYSPPLNHFETTENVSPPVQIVSELRRLDHDEQTDPREPA
jgi:hypothetical protein